MPHLPPGPERLPAPRACLVILDGWGLAPAGPGNAITQAATPVFDELWDRYPHTELTACGPAVGLPEGQMGNSEVGHLNLGAGAVVPQDLARIDAEAAEGFPGNDVIHAAMRDARRVHLIGLTSDGGVHSGPIHLEALIRLAGELGVDDLVLHAFTDGRDTSPTSGKPFLERVEGWMRDAGAGRIGSVVGRYWAMDRDSRWDRTQRAVDLLLNGEAPRRAGSGPDAVRAAYAREETDEFIAPTVVGEEARIDPERDSVLAFNFRPDRMRQLSEKLSGPVRRYATMTEYQEGWPYPVAFPPHRPATTLARVFAAAGDRQLHVAETEKYPHVTYFFNGGEEEAYTGERRELVPSPRDVPTYDFKPEMSAAGAAEAFVAAWREDAPRFGIINFANADMVGHTGSIPAAIAAVEEVDTRLGEVVTAVHESGGVCVICADHGNADEMLEPDGSPDTAHSLNPVPLLVTSTAAGELAGGGVLGDVAPTILALLGSEQPAAMTGRPLLGSV